MKKLALFVLVAGLFSGAVLAQEYQEGIPWGNAYFRPSVEVVYTHSDNIFLIDETMGDRFDDNIWMIRPQVGLELPFKNSYFKVEAQYEYKDYDNYNLLHHSTWFGRLDSQFKFSNGSILTIKDHYIQGVQQTNQFDPDMEVVWNAAPFSRNLAQVGYEIPVSTLNSLTIHIAHNFVDFKSDQDSGKIPFYSYGQQIGGLTWKYNYQPLASLVFEYEHTKSSPRTDNYLYASTDTYLLRRDYREDRISFGWEGDSKRRLSGFAKVGYKKMGFKENDMDDFKGLVADMGLAYKLAEFTEIRGDMFRHANQSAFNVNNYYTATGGQLQLHHQFNRHLFGTVGGKYQVNDYPQVVQADADGDGWLDDIQLIYLQGHRRNDEVMQLLAELGYHFNSRISMRFNYVYENRDSNLKYVDHYGLFRKPYSYDENRLVFQIQMGW